MREVVLVDELAECECYFYGVEVFALNVLNKSHFGQLAVVGGAHIGWHGFESGELGGAVAALTRNDLIGVWPCAAQCERLDYAQLAYRGGQLLKSLFVECAARLVGVGRDLTYADFVDSRRAARLNVVHGNERVESAPQGLSFDFSHL